MKDTVTNQIEDFLRNNPNSFQIVEEQVDIDLQFKYFNLSKKERSSSTSEEVLSVSHLLFEPDTSTEVAKRILVQLAALDSVGALRTIERYCQTATGEMYSWAYLAQKESRLVLESSLLNEKQILISTGLGGKGNLLRYFIVLIAREGNEFSESQKKVIRNEFEFVLGKNESVLEEIKFESKYSQITSLIPLNVSIKNTLRAAVEECNTFGGFLEHNFLVTNVKILNLEEIEQILNDSIKSALENETQTPD